MAVAFDATQKFKEQNSNGSSGCDQIHEDLTKAAVKNPHGSFGHDLNMPKIKMKKQEFQRYRG